MAKKLTSRVFVAMSGGVDSSVAAALLRDSGYQVIGVFIKIANFSEQWGVKCTWREERREAMRAVAHLGIPLVTIDLSKEYEKQVVDYMIREYRAGRTPNPDVMCNREIKFGAFYRWAMVQGADYVATGHYVTIGHEVSKFKLFRAKDPAKDQSYFLWTLTQDQISHCLFPIGTYKKSQVRKLAKKFGLPNAEKKDSQGLCFIGDWNLKDFLAKFIPEKTGKVVNKTGEIIGTHRGAAFYTIGERHGLTITKKTPADQPYYVVAKDIKKNILIVGRRHLDTKCPNLITLSDVNWIVGIAPDLTKIYQVQIRYHGTPYRCRLLVTKNHTQLTFLDQPQACASGQSAVIYDSEVMLGGGVIV